MRNLPTPVETDEEFSRVPTHPIIEMLDANYAQSRVIIDSLLDRQDEIDPNLFAECIEEEVADHTETMAEILGIELTEVQDNIEWLEVDAENAPTITQAIQALIDDDYESAEDGITALAQCLAVDISTAVAYYNGEAVPSTGEAQELVGCFPTLQRNSSAAAHFIALAGGGEFSSQELDQIKAEFNAIKRERAEFNLIQDLQSGLRVYERRVKNLYEHNCLTPAEYQLLMIGGVEADEKADFAAFFSDYSASAGVHPEVQLDRMNFVVDFLERRGQLPVTLLSDFSAYVEPEPLDAQETKYLQEYRLRNPYS